MAKAIMFLTLRRLARDRFFVFINLVGLSLALTCSFVLTLYVAEELSYDKHHKSESRLYRLVNLLNTNGFIEDFSLVPPPIAPLLKQDFNEVEEFVRFRPAGDDYLMRYGDTGNYWNQIYFADNSVFSLFTHHIIAGDPSTALLDPLSIAVSESFARVYFGNETALGKTISSETSNYQITLVFEDLPKNSHLRYDALISYSRLGIPSFSTPDGLSFLGSTSDYTYLLMPDHYDYQSFGESIGESFWQRYMEDRFRGGNSHHQYYLEPLTSIHLQSSTQADLPRGNLFAVQCFIAIIVFLMVVAVINYINLATAFGSKRINQNYLKRLLGASKTSIISQSLLESFFLIGTAFLLGMLLTELILNISPVNQLLAKDLKLSTLLQPVFIGGLTALGLAMSVFCGVIPALGLIHNTKPQSQSRRIKHSSPYRLANILVQFTLTVAVIALSVVMYTQIHYLLNNSWGFDKENRITTRIRGADMVERFDAMRNQLLEHPNIINVTSSSGQLGHGAGIVILGVENNDGEITSETQHTLRISHDYLQTMNMALMAGRTFDPAIARDRRNAALVNESTVNKMGWETAIGKRISNPYSGEDARVIGVVKDFHLHDFGRQIEPTALFFDDVDYSNASIVTRARASRVVTVQFDDEAASTAVVEHLNSVWNEFSTTHPFRYEFLDDYLRKIYTPYEYQMLLVGLFAIISIFIACLGLFGLTVFITQQRTKEIGIRKVLGTTSRQIILLFFKPILLMIVIASLFASVMSFFAADRWLQSFAYRIDITPFPFLIACSLTLILALLTVAILSHKAAQKNPVEALRYE